MGRWCSKVSRKLDYSNYLFIHNSLPGSPSAHSRSSTPKRNTLLANILQSTAHNAPYKCAINALNMKNRGELGTVCRNGGGGERLKSRIIYGHRKTYLFKLSSKPRFTLVGFYWPFCPIPGRFRCWCCCCWGSFSTPRPNHISLGWRVGNVEKVNPSTRAACPCELTTATRTERNETNRFGQNFHPFTNHSFCPPFPWHLHWIYIGTYPTAAALFQQLFHRE